MSRVFVALLAFLACIGAAPAPPTFDVALRPVLVGEAFDALDLTVQFTGEADGETILDLPDAWGGEERLWQALHDVRVDGAHMSPGVDPAHRVLRHAPGARITVRYRVRQERPGAPQAADGRNPYRAIIQPAYFHVLGNVVIATPDHIDRRMPATLTITGMPAGARFASDAEHPGLTAQRLVESVIVGGDFRVLDAGGGARIAIRGRWPLPDAEWRARFARIAAAQRAYWSAGAEPYLVTVLPLAAPPETMSVGGTGREDAFAFFATPSAPIDVIARTLAHEMMHSWAPGRLGGLPERGEEFDYWFSEGFTDWAAWRANVRGGVWSVEEFATVFNTALAAYDLSPARTAPNTRIAEAFWTDQNMQQLPYQRGMLIASLWDYRVLAASNGAKDLDDVLARMLRGAQRRPDVTAVTLLGVAMRRVGGVEIGVDRTELVAEGRPVPLPADLFAPCGAIVAEQRRMWSRGFDFAATQRADWVIAGVAEGNAAWRAGLRNGMRLRAWSERSDQRDATKPVTAAVDDNGVRRDIAWTPFDGEVRTVRRLVLAENLVDNARAACTRRLAGL